MHLCQMHAFCDLFLKAVVGFQNIFAHAVQKALQLLLHKEGRLGETSVPSKGAALTQPILGGAQAAARLKGEYAFITRIQQTVHHIIHVQRAKEGKQMLVLLPSVIIDMHPQKMLVQRHQLLVLTALAVAMPRIPAGVYERVIRSPYKVEHLLSAYREIHVAHILFRGILAKKVYAVLLKQRIKLREKGDVPFGELFL